MPGLPAIGTLSYNGYTFDGTARITCTSNKVRDEADRTVIYIRYEITVEAVIAPAAGDGSTTDTLMRTIHAKLSQDGGTLVFRNKGFGAPILVNGQGGVADVNWGPKTEILRWEPLGSSGACAVTWNVITHLPECCGAGARHSGVMALNFELDYAIDHHGDTIRSITGYIQIAQTRIGPGVACTRRVVGDIADKYRRIIAPNTPRGFKRVQNWHTSKDKSRLNFTIIDTQIPSRNPYPKDVTEISGQHTIQWSRGRGAGFIRHRISVDMMLRAGAPGALSWLIFTTIAAQRMTIARNSGGNRVIGATVLLDELEATEEIFSRRSSFRIGYRSMFGLKAIFGSDKDTTEVGANMIPNSGLWSPLGTDWGLWRASVADTMFDPRGTAKLEPPANVDFIFDLCAGQWPPSPSDEPPIQYPKEEKPAKILKNEKPKKEVSWLEYRPKITLARNTSVVRHRVLQQSDPSSLTNGTGPFDGDAPFSFPASLGTLDTVQQRGKPSYAANFSGMAIRAGYVIPRPSLRTVGGQEAVETDGTFEIVTLANLFGVPIYGAKWDIDYLVAGSPGAVPTIGQA